MATCVRIVPSGDTPATLQRPFYMSAEFREDASGNECFDLIMTDLETAWTATGVKTPEKTAIRDQWIAVAKEAFTGLRDPVLPDASGKQYTWHIKDKEKTMLEVQWRFQMRLAGKPAPTTIKAYAAVEKQPSARPLIEPIVHQLLLNATSYKESALKLQNSHEGFAEEIRKRDEIVKAALSDREKLEENLMVKFAAVLNEKKVHLRDLRDKLADAEARIEQLEQGGAGAADGDAGDTEATERSGETTSTQHSSGAEADGGPAEDTAATAAPDDAAVMDMDTQQLPEDQEMAAAADDAPASREASPKPKRRQAGKRKKVARPLEDIEQHTQTQR